MAKQGVLLDQDQFCCSVCLDLLKEPVTTGCGHSYCRSCIEGCWDQDDQRGVYSCPQCRQTFTPRPALRKNGMLAEVVEKLKAGLQAAPPVLRYAGPGDMACDFCTGTRKQKALMSCLVCLVSYCETHLQPHYDIPGLKKHTLVKATAQLQEKICSHHDKLLEVYCRTDQKCICVLCMDEHKGHDTLSVAAERTEKQTQLGMSQQKVQQRVQRREKELKELQQAVESLKRSAQEAAEDNERIFTELIRSLEKLHTEAKELIKAQAKAQVSRAEGLLEQLEQEIAELKRKDTELEQLSHTEDHIHFLQVTSYSNPSVSSDLPAIVVSPHQYFGDVSEAVSELREKLQGFLKGQWTKISSAVNTVDVLLPPEPNTREQFLQYSCQLTLDPNTAHCNLSLSDGNKKMTAKPGRSYLDHPDRFTDRCQVLCSEGLSGRCYWEVERSGNGVSIAASYKDIKRTGGNDSELGFNDKSWSLQCHHGGYCFRHNSVETQVSGPLPSRVGVYLDHKAGSLSFYSVSGTMSLLHRVQTTFTQPLFPGFCFGFVGDTAELCKL
ncbi:tripartite motif-containing protein 16 isoform X1 [Salmo salar]|uniref:Tripartite motif-containing protein 16 isoform X1 n=1 Tax=Salmo salar TaxID=8030 RepID=A0A1S3PY86_SALSA|nr:tripartite motif-containing protein 16 isoform X1 [Salmo salar]